jgi:hypothetical protein
MQPAAAQPEVLSEADAACPQPAAPVCPLTDQLLSEVRNIRQKLEANGWPIIRVHSPWSLAADRPESRGKQPVAKNWHTLPKDPHLLHAESSTANTGILTAGLRVFDLDVDDPTTVRELLEAISAVTQVSTAELMVRGRGNSARCAVTFRAAEGKPRKRSIVGRDTTGKDGKVEVLGDGQQLVAHGWHSSAPDGSVTYTWLNPPWEVPLEHVPSITEEQVARIMHKISTILTCTTESVSQTTVAPRAAIDWLIPPNVWPPGAVLSPERLRVDNSDLNSETQLGQADIRSCLDALPNDRTDWDWWNTIGMRVYAACGGEDYGLEEWNRWSQTSPANEVADDCKSRWAHFRTSPPTRTGAGALINSIRAASGDAQWRPDGASYFSSGQWPFAAPVTSQVTGRTVLGSEVIDQDDIPQHREWEYGTKLIRGQVTVLGAKGGHGKSAYWTAASCAAASGRDILGDTVWGGPKRVLYINSEDDTDELRRRFIAASRYHGISKSDMANILIRGVDTPGHQTLTTGDDNAAKLNEAGFALLDAIIVEGRPAIVILDPLGTFCPAGLNNNGLMSQVLLRLKRLAKKHGCAILLIHHTRKDLDLTSTDAIGGASAIVNQARAALMLVRMTKEEAAKFKGILSTEVWRYFRILDAKTNLAPPSPDTQWYQLVSYELPNSAPPKYPHGDRIQVVAKLDAHQLTASPIASTLEQAAKRAILVMAANASPPLSPSAKGGSDRYIVPRVLDTVRAATGLNWSDRDLTKHVEVLISEMTAVGWLRVELVKTSGRNTRKGFSVHWAHTPWRDEFGEVDQPEPRPAQREARGASNASN